MSLLRGPELKGWGFVLDLKAVKLKYLRPAVMLKDVAMKAYEYIEDKIECEASLIVANEKRHGFIEGVMQ